MKSIKRLLGIKEVMKIVRRSKVSIYREVSKARRGESRFPIPVGDVKQKLLWHPDDIEAFCRSKASPQGATSGTNPPKRRQTEKSQRQRREATNAALQRHGIQIDSSKKGGGV